MKSNITTLNYNCAGFNDGIFYFMVVAYNQYGNNTSNCHEIKVKHTLPAAGKSDGDDDNGGSDDNFLFIIVVGSAISGVVITSAAIIILRMRKLKMLKKLNKIVKNIQQPKDIQKKEQEDVEYI